MSEVDVIDHFLNTFFNRRDSFYQQQEPVNGKCSYARANRPVDRSVVTNHIAGNITVSAPALSETDTAKWLAWDSDSNDGQLNKVYTYLLEHGFTPLREGRRDNRDGHLWLNLSEPIPGRAAVAFGSYIAAETKTSLEYFPKQAATRSLAGGLRLPLGVNRKPDNQGARSYFEGVKRETVHQLSWLADQEPQPVARILELANNWCIANLSAPRSFTRPFNQRTNMLALVPSEKRVLQTDGNWRTGCPSCIAKGLDNSRDNLSINAGDPSKFRCWRSCSAQEIMRAYGV